MNFKNFEAIVLNENDNVGTSIKNLKKNSKINLKQDNLFINFVIKEDINLCHKFALVKIKKGENILKYGEVIGVAKNCIKKGMHVHIHNIKSLRG